MSWCWDDTYARNVAAAGAAAVAPRGGLALWKTTTPWWNDDRKPLITATYDQQALVHISAAGWGGVLDAFAMTWPLRALDKTLV